MEPGPEGEEHMGQTDPPSVEPLIAALGDPDESARQDAVRALGDTADPRATEPLIAVLGDPVERVRYLAAIALGKIGDRRAAGPLVAMLQAPSDSERRFAAVALGKIGDPEMIEPLSGLLDDPEPVVRNAATASLRQLGADPQADAIEAKKTQALSAAETWWASRGDAVAGVRVCDACGRSIEEQQGTSLVGTYLRCPNCTDRLFTRWTTEGLD